MLLVSFICVPSSFSHVQSGLPADSFFMLRLYFKSWGVKPVAVLMVKDRLLHARQAKKWAQSCCNVGLTVIHSANTF